MTLQVTIIGLGQVGTSVGMALRKYKDDIFRVGHDKFRKAVNFAKENDVVDRTAITLSGGVQDADIVLLALPLQEMYPVLEHIAQDLTEGTLVMDTSPLKTPVVTWMEDLFPSGVHYVGLTPVIKADYLEEMQHGHETGHEDLFSGCLMGLVSKPNTSEKAINMAANFVQLLEAAPYFSEPMEMDGLMSMTHHLPQLLAAAVLGITQKAPGWREARKFAGKHFSQMTNSFGKDELPGALAAWLELNPENATRLLNDVIQELVEMRDAIEEAAPDSLQDGFQSLQQGRDLWLNERTDNPWIDAEKTKLPERRGIFTQMLGFRGPKPRSEDS